MYLLELEFKDSKLDKKYLSLSFDNVSEAFQLLRKIRKSGDFNTFLSVYLFKIESEDYYV